jgi:hypothetical protein
MSDDNQKMTDAKRDANVLAKLTGIRYSRAAAQLRGDEGTRTQRGAERVVEEFAEVVKARTNAGQSFNSASNDVLAERGVEKESAYPIVHSGEQPWHKLHGVLVRCGQSNGARSRSWEGVILPSLKREPHKVRIAITRDGDGTKAGDVREIDARRWRMTPSVEEMMAAPRRAWSSDGYYQYTEDNWPRSVLVTPAGLRDRRRERAADQAQVAALKRRGSRPALFALADTVRHIGSPDAERSADARRTCVICGAYDELPLVEVRPLGVYCGEHAVAARARKREAERVRARDVSWAWSRQVLDDPQTVFVALVFERIWGGGLVVRAEEPDGTVLLSESVPRDQIPSENKVALDRVDTDRLPGWLSAPRARCMLGRRILLTATRGADHAYGALLSLTGQCVGRRAVWPGSGDCLATRYRAWETGEEYPDYRGEADRLPAYVDGWGGRRARRNREYDAEKLLAEVRGKIAEMAAAEVPEERVDFAREWLAVEGHNFLPWKPSINPAAWDLEKRFPRLYGLTK